MGSMSLESQEKGRPSLGVSYILAPPRPCTLYESYILIWVRLVEAVPRTLFTTLGF